MEMDWIRRYEKRLRSAVPDARILDRRAAGHYLYFTREPEVLGELHAFLARLN